MTEAEGLRPLVLDLVEWAADAIRTYAQAMEAWRTSCPRLPVWETALDAGYIRRGWRPAEGSVIEPTDAGLLFLMTYGRRAQSPAVA